jgi:RNA polymerase sigma-70 factor (ECF subfamily)
MILAGERSMSDKRQEDNQVEALTQPRAIPDLRSRLDDLFRRYHKQVFLAAHRVTGNPMDAEDALQTVFMRLLRRSDGQELSDDLSSYLHRAAVNAALDIVRQKRGAKTTALDDDAPIEAEPPGGGGERRVADREIRERVRAAVAKLSPNTAEVFALRYFEGYGNHEIAEMMGTTRSTVGVMLHRARHQIKNEIRDLQENRHEQE